MATHEKELAYWITERERMRVCKEAGEALGAGPGLKHGWSDDRHMGAVRYCNVRREDDKVTKYIAANFRHAEMPYSRMVLCRMINYIPTLQDINHYADFELHDIGVTMKSIRAKGHKIWTSAYTISTCGQRVDKVDYVLGVVQASAAIRGQHRTLQDAWKALCGTMGLGSFLAAQVVADCKNTPGHPLASAPDWGSWSAPGPGSLKGLSEFFERPVTPGTYHAALDQCWLLTKSLLPSDLRDLHMQDFQNCLCEFSKYMRVKRGGHARNKYRPGDN
jgi:hypothetical protein